MPKGVTFLRGGVPLRPQAVVFSASFPLHSPPPGKNMLPFQNTRMGPVMVKEGILESLGCPNEYSRTPKSKEAPTCLLNTQCVPRTALGSLYTYCQLKFCEGGGISSMFSMCKLRVRESRGHLAALAQADGWHHLVPEP